MCRLPFLCLLGKEDLRHARRLNKNDLTASRRLPEQSSLLSVNRLSASLNSPPLILGPLSCLRTDPKIAHKTHHPPPSASMQNVLISFALAKWAIMSGFIREYNSGTQWMSVGRKSLLILFSNNAQAPPETDVRHAQCVSMFMRETLAWIQSSFSSAVLWGREIYLKKKKITSNNLIRQSYQSVMQSSQKYNDIKWIKSCVFGLTL